MKTSSFINNNNFNFGDEVVIIKKSYFGQEGLVNDFNTNLIEVKFNDGSKEKFTPYELIKIKYNIGDTVIDKDDNPQTVKGRELYLNESGPTILYEITAEQLGSVKYVKHATCDKIKAVKDSPRWVDLFKDIKNATNINLKKITLHSDNNAIEILKP